MDGIRVSAIECLSDDEVEWFQKAIAELRTGRYFGKDAMEGGITTSAVGLASSQGDNFCICVLGFNRRCFRLLPEGNDYLGCEVVASALFYSFGQLGPWEGCSAFF